MLTNKNAVIYAAGGSVAGAVAKAFAAAGATVFLTGRNLAPIQKLADDITALGGKAQVAPVDAMDEAAVNAHLNTLVEQAGSVDISFNLIDMQVVQGLPLVDISVADFVRPGANCHAKPFYYCNRGRPGYDETKIGHYFNAYGHARWYRLPLQCRLCTGLLRHRKFIAQPGLRVGGLWR